MNALGGTKRILVVIFGAATLLAAVGWWRVYAQTPGKVPVPTYGAYFGIAPAEKDPASKVSDLEGFIGRNFDAQRIYSDQANPNILAKNSDFQDALEHNRTPWLSIKTNRWDQVAAGRYDNQIDNLADRVKQLNKPIFLTVNYEPEDEVQDSKYTVADYIAAWRRYHSRFAAAGVTNVSWGYVVKATSLDPADSLYGNATTMYPGDDYVDWIGVDAYNMPYDVQAGYDACKAEGAKEGNPQNVTNLIGGRGNYPCQADRYVADALTAKWEDLDSHLGPAYNWVTKTKPGSKALPMALTEWGSTYDWRDPPRRAGWIATAKEDLKAMPAIKLVAYANTPEWELGWPASENSGDDKAVFKSMGEDIYYHQEAPVRDIIPPSIVLIKPTSGVYSGTIEAEATATDNVGIDHVSFTVNDIWLYTDYEAPYTYVRDTNINEDGLYEGIALAFDTAGNVASSTPVSIVVDNFALEPPVIDTFTADPAEVIVGDSALLTWVATNVGSCNVNPDGPQDTMRTGWQTPAFTKVGKVTYTLECSNKNGTVSKEVTLTVVKPKTPPSKPFFATNANEVKPGGDALLNWSSDDASSCEINPGNIVMPGGIGSQLITDIRHTTVFTLKCSNDNGSTEATSLKITVTDEPKVTPQIVKFAFEPAKIKKGQRSTLTSRSSGVAVDGCAIGGTPYVGLSGNFDITTPPLEKSMTLTQVCRGTDGQTVSATTSITVDGVPAPPPGPTPPPPKSRIVEGVSATRQERTDELSGATVVSSQTRAAVVKGELITLTPALRDARFAQLVEKVDYYEGEKLVQSVDEPPFALDSSLLGSGEHTITERIYMLDGVVTLRTQQIEVSEPIPVDKFATLAGGISAVLLVVAYLVYYYTPISDVIYRSHTKGSKKS